MLLDSTRQKGAATHHYLGHSGRNGITNIAPSSAACSRSSSAWTRPGSTRCFPAREPGTSGSCEGGGASRRQGADATDGSERDN